MFPRYIPATDFGHILEHMISSLHRRKIYCFHVAGNEGKTTLFSEAALQIILILFGILGWFNSAMIWKNDKRCSFSYDFLGLHHASNLTALIQVF
jgi:hypothetical protein